MEEDDHDELLQCTDDETSSDSDDQSLMIDKPPEVQNSHRFHALHYTKLHFILLLATVIISSTILTIVLPLYIESANVKSDAYVVLQFITMFTTIILIITKLILKKLNQNDPSFSCYKSPVCWRKLMKMCMLYTASGFMIIYGIDRKRVICHIQDPIKGIVLVFSLIYYFFFCKKLMGLQHIFATTTVIVGLFISVDYGLCDEFRCRGMERNQKSDDGGLWSWKMHTFWATIYICGLSLYAAYCTLLERNLVPSTNVPIFINRSQSLLTTVSRMVSSHDSSAPLESQLISQLTPIFGSPTPRNVPSALNLAIWIHLFSWILTSLVFWLDLLPTVGKADGFGEFLVYMKNGLICHFSSSVSNENCANVALFAWLFIVTYVIFVLSSIRFLILSQSAVFMVASSTAALPLTGMWWSLFRVTSVDQGLIMWSPSVTGELICALMGLPIVIIGLALFCKSHFKDSQVTRSDTHRATTSTSTA